MSFDLPASYDTWKTAGPPDQPLWECSCGDEHPYDSDPCEGCGESKEEPDGPESQFDTIAERDDYYAD